MSSDRESCEEYSFNRALDEDLNDGFCEHCAKYLTVHCPHIDDFLEENLEDE